MNPENSEGVISFLNTGNVTEAGILTAEDIRKALDTVRDTQHQESLRHIGNASKLMEATPAHLRTHPFVQALAMAIGNGAIFHPKDAERAREEWERLCREG